MSTAQQPPPPPGPGAGSSRGLIRLALAIAGVVAVGVVVWLIVRDGDDKPAAPAAKAVSVEEIQEFAESVEHPVFWAGPRADTTYELTRTGDGRVYIRYLPAGVSVGDPRPQFLTVGTYPLENGYEQLRAVSRRKGATRRRLRNDGLAVLSEGAPTSAYLAYPDGGYQVEVFDPVPRRALNLIVAGRIRPVR